MGITFNLAMVCLISLALLVPMVSLEGQPAVSGIPTRNGDLAMDMDISERSFATFLGENIQDGAGYSVAGIGDVNGDGLNDFLIGSMWNDEGGSAAGQTYLIFGNANGWPMDMNLTFSDASFLGKLYGGSGESVCSAGDVNGDGINDFLIAAHFDMDGAQQAGKVYLYLGKKSGWSMDTPDSMASTKFIGEHSFEEIGVSISGGGDVNGDGYDDILIGSHGMMSGGSKAYLFFGKQSGWPKTVLISSADSIFEPENEIDYLGETVCIAGDLNGDSYDDIVLGARLNDQGGDDAGKTYVIFGKPTGWSSTFDVTESDATFIGENNQDHSGDTVAGIGDINNDYYDDLLIGSPDNSENGGSCGQVYLILGKETGWQKDVDLSDVDASYLGETSFNSAGEGIAGIGDFNGDGYNDFMIGSPDNDEGGDGAGQAYIIFGKSSGWEMDTLLLNADASLIGEAEVDNFGFSISGLGDVNGDGVNDIIISANHNSQIGYAVGKIYLVSGVEYREPYEIYDITVKDTLGAETKRADKEDIIKVEMTGRDSNASMINRARVNVTFSKTKPYVVTISLIETGSNTGIYKGSFRVPKRTEYFERMRFSAFIDPSKYKDVTVDYPYRPSSVTSIGVYSSPTSPSIADKLDLGDTGYFKCIGIDSNPATFDKAFVNLSSDKNSSFQQMIILTETGQSTGTYIASYTVPDSMRYFENITLTSVETPSIKANFMVHTPVQIRASGFYTVATEDYEYNAKFYNFGYNSVTWSATTDAYWLTWDISKLELRGMPKNNDVGKELWNILITITDNFENTDNFQYALSVQNLPPKIITEPLLLGTEKKEYALDLNSDDDDQGDISWYLNSNSPFLNIDKMTGLLKGTPIEGDAGEYFVNVQVQDGNGGSDYLNFNLTVLGKNDRPRITTTDIVQIEQDTPFRRDYEVFDPDEGDTHNWILRTDADWLSMENGTGVLFGTPDGYDVGYWSVNITVTDQGGLNDYREFSLRVLDVKDKPRFDNVPTDIELVHGTNYYFDVNASDADGDKVIFNVVTDPSSTMVIDSTLGDLRWRANYRSMPATGKGMKVILKASDGQLFSTYEFYIKVTPTQSPSSELVSPAKGTRSRSVYTLLEWIGTDPENEPLKYVLYLADSESYITAKRSENIISNGIEDNFYNLTGLTQGKTYYWTVVPDDGCTYGTCANGIFSFRVNNKPSVESIDDQTAQAGEEFMVKVTGSDSDQDDTKTYRIVSGPSGMTIRSSGMIVWTPKDSQIGVHTIIVAVSDGYEETVESFQIEVGEREGLNIGLIIGIIVVILVLIIIGLLLYIFVIKGKGEEQKEEEDEEAKKMREEMEQKQKEREWEEAHMRPTEQQTVTSVPLSADEAHAHDRDSKPKGYEELYGQPAPDKSEELTTEELRNELEKLTDDLKGQMSEGEEDIEN